MMLHLRRRQHVEHHAANADTERLQTAITARQCNTVPLKHLIVRRVVHEQAKIRNKISNN